MDTQSALVGRDAERRLLSSALRESAAGSPSAVLIGGEAGVGKTSLVAEVTEQLAADDHLVLWGRCLRFGADSSPYLPIGQVLTQWYRQADPAERQRVLAGGDELATIAPSLGTATGRVESGQLISLAATVIDRIAETTPTVLVIDDLQWCDTTSLDLLAYLLAGFTNGQRLTVIATYRDTDLADGHRLHGWLADMRRLPSVVPMRLGRLGLLETEELVARTQGPGGTARQVSELFERSGGNPYLTELLARSSADQDGLSTDRVGDLREVVLASWHRLSGPARELMQLLAVGGRPVATGVLERLAGAHGLGADKVRPCMAEATAEGVAATVGQDDVWFQHPLLAEVIASTLDSTELVRIHRLYVDVLEAADDLPVASRAAHLALHHDSGAHPDEAFTWSLDAAADAADVLGFAEEFQHLHRACRLWPQVDPAVRGSDADRVRLLGRAADSAMRAGRLSLALELREQALDLVDREARPLETARLMFGLPLCRAQREADEKPYEPAQAISLTADFPDSAEHAIALAQMAYAEVWGAEPDADAHADRAVVIARRADSDEALAWALGARSQTRCHALEGLRDAEEAVERALRTGDRLLVAIASFWRCNNFEALGRVSEAADATIGMFRELSASGSVYEAVQGATVACRWLVELGRWSEARDVLREILSRRLESRVGAEARAIAADLAWRVGDLPSAKHHLGRARELQPTPLLVGSYILDMEVHTAWAAGEPSRALDLIDEAMPLNVQIDPTASDELLLWAARCAATLAEQTGDRAAAVARLDRLEQVRGQEPLPFRSVTPEDTVHPAFGSLFAAERARCHGDKTDLADLWRAAVEACAVAGLVWEQAYASYREAQALLAASGNRQAASAALRTAARIATDLGATPILTDVQALAGQAHIILDEPVEHAPQEAVPPALATLTKREREVLGPLVAGRTYAEIAASLFISEKTVSVHVSNILRKTGTSSRIEVAQLARRADADAGSHDAEPARA